MSQFQSSGDRNVLLKIANILKNKYLNFLLGFLHNNSNVFIFIKFFIFFFLDCMYKIYTIVFYSHTLYL